ncbi:hypothetical protein T4E_4965, partial [Trichinella pseudospiralis]
LFNAWLISFSVQCDSFGQFVQIAFCFPTSGFNGFLLFLATFGPVRQAYPVSFSSRKSVLIIIFRFFICCHWLHWCCADLVLKIFKFHFLCSVPFFYILFIFCCPSATGNHARACLSSSYFCLI